MGYILTRLSLPSWILAVTAVAGGPLWAAGSRLTMPSIDPDLQLAVLNVENATAKVTFAAYTDQGALVFAPHATNPVEVEIAPARSNHESRA